MKENFNTKLGRGALDGSVIDTVDDVMRIHAVHGAADGLRGAENLLHAAAELLAHGARPHHAGSLDDVVHRDVAVVFDVLDLLPVPGRLLQRLDDEGGGGGNHGAGGLSVLHLQLHGHLQTLPVAGGLGNVVSDLLGGQTEGTNLKWKKFQIKISQHVQIHYQFVEFCTETVTYLEDGIQLGRSWTPKA